MINDDKPLDIHNVAALALCKHITVLSTPTISELPVDTLAFQLLMPSLPLCLLTAVQVFGLCIYHSSQTLATWRATFLFCAVVPTVSFLPCSPFDTTFLTQLIPVFFSPINLHPVSAFPLTKGVPTIASTPISTSFPSFPCSYLLSASPAQVILHFSAVPYMTGSNTDLLHLSLFSGVCVLVMSHN